jgi:hypothetical protein
MERRGKRRILPKYEMPVPDATDAGSEAHHYREGCIVPPLAKI